jgi:electron transport complex protein RnfC
MDGDKGVETAVSNAFLPSVAVVPLKQHVGESARCVVGRGDRVREGMVIGRSEGPRSADVHAPIPGTVLDIKTIALPEGGESEAVVIALEGSFDRLGRREERYLWRSMTRHDMLSAVRDRGVVAAEGPGIPLYDLLSGSRDIGLLILNVVESEPYLRTEKCLSEARGADIIEGLGIIRKIVNPARTIVATSAVSGGRSASGRSIEEIAAAAPKEFGQDGGWTIETIAFEPKYPQELHGQIIEAIEGARKRKAGDYLIVTPSTVLAAYEAVVLAKPMIERCVVVDGGALRDPAILKVRIGTPLRDLIEECGGFSQKPERLVVCGPFRGCAIYDLDTPITKTTSAVLALDRREVRPGRTAPCIRCGNCAEVCPERLDPQMIFRLLDRGRIMEAGELGLESCTLCGSCSYVCPSRVPLAAAFASRLRLVETVLDRFMKPEIGLSVSHAPFMFQPRTVSSLAWGTAAVLSPAVVHGVLVFGPPAALVLAIAVLAALTGEACVEALRKRFTLWDGTAFLTGMLIGLSLPPDIPPFVPAAASLFAVIVVKGAFGGLGSNWMNPALAGVAFALLDWPAAMSRHSAAPFWRSLIAQPASSFSNIDAAVTDTLNRALFSRIGADLPYGYIDLLIGRTSGAIGEASGLLVLAASIVLLARRMVRWEIPASILASLSMMSWIFGGLDEGRGFFSGDLLFSIFSGSILLVAFFMATDPVTSPCSRFAMIVYGTGIGVIVYALRSLGSASDGSAFAVIIMNCAVPALSKLDVAAARSRLNIASKLTRLTRQGGERG